MKWQLESVHISHNDTYFSLQKKEHFPLEHTSGL